MLYPWLQLASQYRVNSINSGGLAQSTVCMVNMYTGSGLDV